MSWLKSAVNKGREKVEALSKSGALQAVAEQTTKVVGSAANRVLKARAKNVSTIEFEAKLEEKAQKSRTLATCQELHRSWVESIGAKNGPKSMEGDRELGFKEMLLQSRALEITIETIAVDPMLRLAYGEAPAADDKTSPVATLYELLSKTLSCPASHWSEVLQVTMAGEGLSSEVHISWLSGVISAMKIDWHEEGLYTERKDLALRAEYLRQEIKGLEANSGGAASGSTAGKEDAALYAASVARADERHRRRVAASCELLQTYQAVRRNLEEAQAHRQEVFESREADLNLIVEQVQAHIVSLQGSVQNSTERHKTLEGELKQSHDSIQLQLQHMEQVRVDIDNELEQLEERKRTLRIELDEVSVKLDEARVKQRQHMEKCDAQRAELSEVKQGFKQKIEGEGQTQEKAAQEQEVIERTRQLVQDTDALVQKTLGVQLEELKKKQVQFKEHFQELLKEHLNYSEEQLLHLRKRVEGLEGSAPDAPERVELWQAAEAAQEAFQRFRDEQQELLAGTEAEAMVQRLASEHGAVMDLLKASAPAVAPSAAAPVEEAAPAAEAAPAERTLAPEGSPAEKRAAPQVVEAEAAMAPAAAAVAEPATAPVAEAAAPSAGPATVPVADVAPAAPVVEPSTAPVVEVAPAAPVVEPSTAPVAEAVTAATTAATAPEPVAAAFDPPPRPAVAEVAPSPAPSAAASAEVAPEAPGKAAAVDEKETAPLL